MPAPSKILVPIDWSPHSREAVRQALELARRLGAELRLLHVRDLPYALQYVIGEGQLPGIPAEERDQDALRALDEFVAGCDRGPVKITTAVRTGQPAEQILAETRESGAGMVVMGTHGRTGLMRALLGSQAELVVRRAEVPVLIVHAPAEEMAARSEAGAA